MTRVCLDLFSGHGGFSAAFEDADGWEVFSVDLDPDDRFDPDLKADVMDLRPADLLDLIGYERDEIDRLVILLSPPCTDFSPVAWSHGKRVDTDGTPITENAQESIALVYHTLGLIHAKAPDYWLMENPRGALRWVIGPPVATVDYCRYGHYTKKPTDLWGDHPPGMDYRRCDHESHTREDGVTDFELGPSDPSERAEVPYELSEAILEAVEGRAEQTTLPGVESS